MEELADPDGSCAVLIGASRFPDDPALHALPAVGANLTRLAGLLSEERVWGIPEDRVAVLGQTELLHGGAAVRVLNTVHLAGRRAKDLLLVYYAGHGLLDPEDRLNLALPETNSDALHTALEYEALRRVLAQARVPRKVLILDCCFAGAASGSRMGGDAIRRGPMPPTGSFLLGAASATATALAAPGEPYTAFTGELIAVLDRGIDGGDPVLRMDTLFAHLDAVLEQKGRPRPWPDARGHGGAIVLARNVAFQPSEPALPDVLASLARAQRRAGDAFPYKLAGTHRTHLDAVYVRQDLRRNSAEPTDSMDDADSAEAPRRDSGGTDTLPAGPAVVLDDLLRSRRHLVVVGSAGQGKTTMTLRLATRLADEWLRPSQDSPASDSEPGGIGALGIRVAARALVEESLPWDQMIARAATRELGPMLDRELPSGLLDLVPAGAEWLVIVDGLDEIADPWNRREVIRQLAGRAVSDPRLRLLVTTRDLPGDELELLEQIGAARYALAPFETEQLTAFIKAWFGPGPEGERLAAGFLAGIDSAGPRELLCVPLFATVAAILYQQHPESRLPGSIFTLYEQYLGYLAAARFGQTARQWLDVRARVAAALDGDSTAAVRLQTERGALVEHLAVCAVAGDDDLLSAAVSWMDERGGRRANTRLPDWPDLIASMLDATGLFLHTPHLRFVHLSLAEHLAASAQARELPASLDPADPSWKAKVRTAARKGHGLSLEVLLHHAQQHPGTEDALDWLEGGTFEARMIAGRLLADGFPASSAHKARFLATLRDAARQARHVWHGSVLTRGLEAAARLQDDSADRVLLEIARDRGFPAELRSEAAALLPRHHRGVALQTLRDVIADRTTDIDDRQEAAGALAALAPELVAEAARALHGMAAEPAVSMSDRRASARALARLGPAQASGAADILRSIIADPAADSDAREDAATDLADLGPSYTAEAAETLRAIISGPTGDDNDRCRAAEELAELGPAYAAEAGEELRAIAARGPAGLNSGRLARVLSKLGSEYIPDAAELLRGQIAAPATGASDRVSAAEDLADFGPAYAAEAIETLRAMVADPNTKASELTDAASVLAALDPQYVHEATLALRSVSAGAGVDADIRRWAAVKLAKYRPEATAEAAELLAALCSECAVDLEQLFDVLDSLGDLGPQYGAEVTRLYRAAMPHSATSVFAKLRIARLLADSDPVATVEAVRAVASDPGVPGALRCSAANFLADCGPEHAAAAADALRAVMDASTVDVDDRMRAAGELRAFGPEFRTEANRALRTLILAAEIDAADRTKISAELARCGDELSSARIQGLHAILTDPATGPYYRSEAARALAGLGTEHARAAAEALRADARSTSDTALRWQAVGALAALGPPYTMEAAEIARAELADPASDSYGRRRAAQKMADLGPDYAAEAIEALHALLADPEVERFDRHLIASALAEVEPSFASQVAEMLLTEVADRSLHPYYRWHAAKALQLAGDGFTEPAAAALLAGATEPAISVEDRVEAARLLADSSFKNTDGAAEVLRVVITDGTTGCTDRWQAAEVLAELAPGQTDEAARALRTVISDSAAAPFDRRWCAVALARLGPEYAAEAALSLHATLTDSEGPFDRRWSALALSLLGSEHLVYAAETLRTILADPNTDPWELEDTAKALADLGPRYVEEAAELLRSAIGDAESGWLPRRLAAQALAHLGPGHVARACEGLRAMLDDPEIPLYEYWPVARSLIDLNPEFVLEVAEEARADLVDPDIGAYYRCSAALMLAELVPESGAEAAHFLRTVSSDASAHPGERYLATSFLIRIDQHDAAQAAEVLRAVLGHPDASTNLRLYAASTLAGLSPESVAEAVRVLRSVLADPDVEPDPWRTAVGLLANSGAEYKAEIMRVLGRMIAEAAPEDAILVEARKASAELSRQPDAEAAQAGRGTVSYSATADTQHIAGELLADLKAAVKGTSSIPSRPTADFRPV